MTTEHLVPQSESGGQRSTYDNCVNACRYCNRSRSNQARFDRSDRRLLNPTEVAWAARFIQRGDRIEPGDGDLDASYTEAAYELNDELKLALRARRRTLLGEWLESLRELPGQIDRLREIEPRLPEKDRRAVAKAIARFEEQLRRARRNLADYAAIPKDSNATCRCPSMEHHRLPEWLENQTLQVLTQ